MTLKSLLASVAIVVMSCAHNPFPMTCDTAAKQAQEEMQSTVYIEFSYHAIGKIAYKDGSSKDIDSDMGWKASGVVVEAFNGKSAILTAKHAVDSPQNIVITDDYFVILTSITDQSFTITRLDGMQCSAHVAGKFADDDLGLLVADCIAGKPAKIAHDLPPIGAHIEAVGCPDGTHSDYSFSVLDGRYQGLISEKDAEGTSVKESVSIPVIGGVSGSAAYYNGELIGIITAGLPAFEHLSYAVQLSHVRQFLGLK